MPGEQPPERRPAPGDQVPADQVPAEQVPAAWTFADEPVAIGGDVETVTLVEGRSFVVCAKSGDVAPRSPQGLFLGDTRFLSGWRLRLDGQAPQALAVVSPTPFSATFVGRVRPGDDKADSHLLVVRRRFVGRGMREDLTVRNLSSATQRCRLTLRAAADFADLFAVKEGRADPDMACPPTLGPGGELAFSRQDGPAGHGTRIGGLPMPEVAGDELCFTVEVGPRQEWHASLQVVATFDGVEVCPRYRCDEPVEGSLPARRHRSWRRRVPEVSTDHSGLAAALSHSQEDLGALRIFDPDFPDRAAVAAGAPWFMTIFGRDSLLAAWMALPLDPGLAAGVLRTLARFQGREVRPSTEEEPGRILHEMRFFTDASLSLGGGEVYYGTVDATALFVMLLGEARRWGLDRAVVEELLPHADRALEWIESFGDRDGDGFVEYRRASPEGLFNQGWKDSHDGITHADGALPEPPIALAEVQGYCYGAYLARADLAREAGDEATVRDCLARAQSLKDHFDEAFWLADRGWYALGLDGAKRPIDALASNMGHCLWTGIVADERAAQVVERLLGPEMFTGYGVRTLASSMVAYNPVSYHNGSVWPHDNAIIAAGLVRYGYLEEAQRVASGLLDAAEAFDGRLPELFCGFGRDEFDVPVRYPTACQPQAWAAAAPWLVLRTLLGFDPEVPDGRLWVDPALPATIGRLRIEHLPLAGGRLVVEVAGGQLTLSGVPGGLAVVTSARPLVDPSGSRSGRSLA